MIKTKVFTICEYRSERHNGNNPRCFDFLVCHYFFGFLVWSVQVVGVLEYDIFRILGKRCAIDKNYQYYV